jgi:XRE family aerobic/anaerobic benzoate catabolism transcriptional regulator
MKPARAKSAVRPAAGRETDAYLRRLGERVRTLRNQRGMTRKALARHAKVSERYLAQLEAGLGNGSIVLLRRISRAIGLPVTQLVHEGSEPALDLVLLSQFLERLSPAALTERATCCSSISASPRPTRAASHRADQACAAAASPRSAGCSPNGSASPSSS